MGLRKLSPIEKKVNKIYQIVLPIVVNEPLIIPPVVKGERGDVDDKKLVMKFIPKRNTRKPLPCKPISQKSHHDQIHQTLIFNLKRNKTASSIIRLQITPPRSQSKKSRGVLLQSPTLTQSTKLQMFLNLTKGLYLGLQKGIKFVNTLIATIDNGDYRMI
jgi:hypothetical protein